MFTTSCFIRKNTPKIRKMLVELGYKRIISISKNKNEKKYIFCYGKYYSEEGIYFIKNIMNKCIYCFYNEELFLAIAALRDDSDYMQWFIYGNEFILCDREDWIDMISTLCCGGRYNYDRNGELSQYFHKATVEELINHFKN